MAIVDAKCYSLEEIFGERYNVDFYQREYVWETKHIVDLIRDLSNEFLNNYKDDDNKNTSENKYEVVKKYNPYFLGEIVVSIANGSNFVIDGQQRLTSLTLLLIYIFRRFKSVKDFPEDFITMIYKNDYGKKKFPITIDERTKYMNKLLDDGDFELDVTDKGNTSLINIINRYREIDDNWDSKINENNIVFFALWLQKNVKFSKVWTDSDDFAYVIFETMNDRGCSLTNTEMLKSFILSRIDIAKRDKCKIQFEGILANLNKIKKDSDPEFFKSYFRSQFAEGDAQSKNKGSDYNLIGKSFHRWVRDNQKKLNLSNSDSFVEFLSRIEYFADVYTKINQIIEQCDHSNYLYMIVNRYYNSTLQPSLILSSINYKDSPDIVSRKMKIVSKFLCRILSTRVWNHRNIGQSSMDETIFKISQDIRTKEINSIVNILKSTSSDEKMQNSPILNGQNKSKLRALLALITSIVSRESGENSTFILCDSTINVEHITCDHYNWFKDDYQGEMDFNNYRNNIGDLLLLPEAYNKSYGDKIYEKKIDYYYSQNILAKTLCKLNYSHNPPFIDYISRSGIQFKPYKTFKRENIEERAELYKSILDHDFSEL